MQLLLRQLGLGDQLDVVSVAVQAPLSASAVKHLLHDVGLDTDTITAQWQRMVVTLVNGVIPS